MESAKLIIEVVAGVIPDRPIEEYTKRWWVTSQEWHDAKVDGVSDLDGAAGALIARPAAQADEYARTLRDPSRVNWVRVDWVWI